MNYIDFSSQQGKRKLTAFQNLLLILKTGLIWYALFFFMIMCIFIALGDLFSHGLDGLLELLLFLPIAAVFWFLGEKRRKSGWIWIPKNNDYAVISMLKVNGITRKLGKENYALDLNLAKELEYYLSVHYRWNWKNAWFNYQNYSNVLTLPIVVTNLFINNGKVTGKVKIQIINGNIPNDFQNIISDLIKEINPSLVVDVSIPEIGRDTVVYKIGK